MSLHIYIDTIAHSEQRYETVGDYWRPALPAGSIERTEIRVSQMDNEKYELLVAIHEMIEEHLTRERGVTEAEITAYDVQYEASRTSESLEEPGDNPDAPYHKEHVLATEIERFIAAKLGVNWIDYERTIQNLSAAGTAGAI